MLIRLSSPRDQSTGWNARPRAFLPLPRCARRCLHSRVAATVRRLGASAPGCPQACSALPRPKPAHRRRRRCSGIIEPSEGRWISKLLPKGGHRENPIQEDIMDPVENASRRSRWAVSGPESAISKVFSVLDSSLPNGWKRLTGQDLLPYISMVKQGSGWYAIDTTPSSVGVTLSIERPRESELRGGRVWFAKPPYTTGKPSVPAAWDQVSRFLDEGVIPAARAAGANIRVPTAEDAFLSNLPLGA